MPKLDDERLLSREGLPALVQLCKEFKPRGKGHEVSYDDLKSLFRLLINCILSPLFLSLFRMMMKMYVLRAILSVWLYFTVMYYSILYYLTLANGSWRT